MTVLFSDIRSFTDLSEAMSPGDLFNFLNAFLGRMGPIISKNNGFIDKFIGDAIMALFENPDDAVRASLEMLKELESYNSYRLEKERDPIAIGIGLNSGTLRLGTIGEKGRLEGTVIGDAVNLASRMEGLTKMYGASLLISDKTYAAIELISKKFIRAVDRVAVKGKTEAITIYEVLDGDKLETRMMKKNTVKDFNQGFAAYYKREFKVAQEQFEAVLEVNKQDKAASIFAQRCRELTETGVPDGWDGVKRLDTK